MAVYSKERPELELESFFRSLYPSTRRGIRENWLRLQEDPDDTLASTHLQEVHQFTGMVVL